MAEGSEWSVGCRWNCGDSRGVVIVGEQPLLLL